MVEEANRTLPAGRDETRRRDMNVPVVSYPARGLRGTCPEGQTILEALWDLGYVIDHACGGNALCGTCCVNVVEGASHLSPLGSGEAEVLRELGVEPPHRLSCQARIHGEIVVLPGC